MRALLRHLALAAVSLLLAAPSFAAATIVINNLNGPGVGFNDATPAAPVGGNPGTTIGQQRLNCFQQAASIWGATLSSNITITINAQFTPLTCSATSAVLGSAGAASIWRDFSGAPLAGHWYSQALANKLSNSALGGLGAADINANFNINLGTTGCLTGSGWYYGFDHNEGALIDLVAVLLHEFAHGLGFQTFTSGSTGSYNASFPSVWDAFLYDEVTGLHWDQASAAQRAASAISVGNLTWDGADTKAAAPGFLSHPPELAVPYSPFSVDCNAAAFGAALTLGGVTAQAVVANDGVGTTSDGCEPIAGSVAGRIAVIDRGTCTFVIKAKNAQNAGAIGVILVNNTTGALAPGGSDPTITIPVIGITQADGATLKTAIAGGPTTVTLRLHPTNIAGLHPSGRVRMYAPNPFQGGSSVSHFDVSLSPNALMEPAINADLTGNLDLTVPLFRDIGWLPSVLGVPGGGPSARVALASRPNPARGTVNVHFELSSDENVELSLFDVAGREVRTLAKSRFAAGSHDLAWDGLDAAGRPASPGIYLARLKGPRTQATHHIVLMQ